MEWFDYRLLAKLPRLVFYFWGLFVLVTLLSTLQQATLIFYGPSRVLYADGATITGTVSTQWAENFGLLLIPSAWLLMWCALRFRIALLVAFVAAILYGVWGFIAFEVLDQWHSSSYGWQYTGDPGRGIAGYFSNRTILDAIHDPAEAAETMLGLAGWSAFLLMLLSGRFYALYHARRIEDVCTECGYDLRGTPNRVCPECGVHNEPN